MFGLFVPNCLALHLERLVQTKKHDMPNEVLFDEKKVLQKAMQLFWLKGYNGTSLDDLLKTTGLSRSSIYNSYGNKQGIFMQCLQYYRDWVLDTVTESVTKLKSPVKKIEIVFKISIDKLLKDKERKGCLIVNTATELANLEEEISLFMKGFEKELETLFQDWIKEGQQTGEISKSFSSLALSRHLYNSYQGIKIIAKTTNDRKTLEDIVNVSISVLKQ